MNPKNENTVFTAWKNDSNRLENLNEKYEKNKSLKKNFFYNVTDSSLFTPDFSDIAKHTFLRPAIVLLFLHFFISIGSESVDFFSKNWLIFYIVLSIVLGAVYCWYLYNFYEEYQKLENEIYTFNEDLYKRAAKLIQIKGSSDFIDITILKSFMKKYEKDMNIRETLANASAQAFTSKAWGSANSASDALNKGMFVDDSDTIMDGLKGSNSSQKASDAIKDGMRGSN
ncbi:MAG: hypothetical protein HXX18_02520 [Bacteroidetes bacterium]|nr:hypothetical protein [Bacteroidota bacterium]